MTQGNAEVVRGVYESFARQEFPADLFHEDVCWETSPELPDAGVHRGIDAVRSYFSDWVAAWHAVGSEVEHLFERGDRVITLIHGTFQLLPDSQPFEADYGHVWTLRDGKVIQVRATADRADPELTE